jgi:hypothetical protein
MNRISTHTKTRLVRFNSIKPYQPSLFSIFTNIFNTPKGIRIPVTSVKGRCPRPLDDGGSFQSTITKVTTNSINVNT